MALQMIETDSGKMLELRISGKFVAADFQQLESEFQRLVQEHRKLRVLLLMVDFHGWDGASIWDEVKFDAKHRSEIEKLAMVGDKSWEKFLAAFARPFTPAEIRFFEMALLDEAMKWLRS